MSRDIKMFTACNHIVNNEKYESSECPRCWGVNYYYDLTFNNEGEIITTEGEIKLQQEVLKIMNDKKGGNMFFLEWGNPILTDEYIGKKNSHAMSERIRMAIYETLQHLKNVQINNQIIFNNMTQQEIIEDIEEIVVRSIPPSGYVISIKFTNAIDQIYEQTIVL